MKRLIIAVVMAAFILGSAGTAKAVHDLYMHAVDYRVHANYIHNEGFNDDLKIDELNFYQRFRSTFHWVANENVRAVLQMSFGETQQRWGTDGYRIGGVNRDVVFRQAYLDFLVPQTDVLVRAGWQYWTLPSTLSSHIWDVRAPAVIVSSPITPGVDLTLGYAMGGDEFRQVFDFDKGEFTRSRDEFHHFFGILPIAMDGFEINPFLWYAHSGKYEQRLGTEPTPGGLVGSNTPPWDGARSTDVFFAGVNFSMDMFDPIVIHADFNYGTAGKLHDDIKGTSGWIANVALDYQMDMMTPRVFFLWESGESSSSFEDDRTGRVMPNLGTGDLGFTSFGFAGSQFEGTPAARAFGGSHVGGASGKAALGLSLMDINLVESMTHNFNLVYYQGTNHKDMRDFLDSGVMLTTRDHAWEVNFDTQYDVYENLAAILELGYIAPSLSDGADGTIGEDRSDFDDNAFKAALGFRLTF